MSYEADVTRARRLVPIVQEGFAASLTEAAIRFAILAAGYWDHFGRNSSAALIRECARRS